MSAARGGRRRKNATTDQQESKPIMAAKQPAAKAAPSKTSKASPAKPVGKPTATKATLPKPSKPVAAKPPSSGAKTMPVKALASKTPAAAKAKPTPAATVTLKHLAAEIADGQQIAKRDADMILTSLVGLLVQHLKNGDRLRIGGLGILEVKNRPERAGRNPATGEAITIKASKKIAFRPAKELKEAV
jgi:DNA-binding protein HU-beta